MPKPTNFDVTGSLEGDVLVVRFSGRSTADNARAMARRYFDVLLASGKKKVLADLRELKGRLSSGETYFLLRDLPVKPTPRGIKTAILESEDQSKFATFFETTANNAGLELKCFFDREKALAWLGNGAGR